MRMLLRILLTVLMTAWSAPALAGSRAPLHGKKVLVVVFENADYAKALRTPELGDFARSGALLADFHGETHPSQPNYVALVAGDTLGVKKDKDADLDAPNLADRLEAAHRSWKTYLEGYPGGCFSGSRSGEYVRKHNPLVDFASIRKDPVRCSRLVPAAQLAEDLRSGALPDFALYIPDLRNDGHDTDAAYAGRWLSRSLLPQLRERMARDLVVVVTFDESESDGRVNHIYTALAGAGVKPGARSDRRYDHYSLLRTIEESFGLGTLGKNDERSQEITDVWS